jgi:hypothetical protein
MGTIIGRTDIAADVLSSILTSNITKQNHKRKELTDKRSSIAGSKSNQILKRNNKYWDKKHKKTDKRLRIFQEKGKTLFVEEYFLKGDGAISIIFQEILQ